MHAGYLYILLSLASYSTLGVLHKVAEVRTCRAEAISILMCAWSLVLLVGTNLLAGRTFHTPVHIAALALPFGMCAGIAILALQSALSLGNISTSWLAVNLSAGIPTILSILLYGEPINFRKLIALVCMVFAMLLLWKDSRFKGRPVSELTNV